MLPVPLVLVVVAVIGAVVYLVLKNKGSGTPVCTPACVLPQTCVAGICKTPAPACTTGCTLPAGCVGGTCTTPPAPTVCTPPCSYKSEANQHKNASWGCQYPGAGLPSSVAPDPFITNLKAMCDLRPDCIGYYINQNNSWAIATNVEPSECTDTNTDIYPNFYRKVAG